MNNDEIMEILKKYDRLLYEYYIKNAWFLGCDARRWAEKLKRENEIER